MPHARGFKVATPLAPRSEQGLAGSCMLLEFPNARKLSGFDAAVESVCDGNVLEPGLVPVDGLV